MQTGASFTSKLLAREPDRLEGQNGTPREEREETDGRVGQILVVDEDPRTESIVRAGLESAEFRCISTTDPDVALSWATGRQVQAVVLDLSVAGTAGYDILAVLKSHRQARRLPVLTLSERSEAVGRLLALRQGSDDHVFKPLEARRLLNRLTKLLSIELGPVALEGDLDVCEIVDVMRALELTSKNGLLEVFTEEHHGRFELASGGCVDARFGPARGWEALLSVTEVKDGLFRYRPAVSTNGSDQNEAISMRTIAAHAAWTVDELGRREHLLPAEDLPLTANAASDEAEELPENVPTDEIREALLDSPGTTMRELLDSGRWSPNSLRLALALLVQNELVAAAMFHR